jgi:hypothetical protein
MYRTDRENTTTWYSKTRRIGRLQFGLRVHLHRGLGPVTSLGDRWVFQPWTTWDRRP